MTSSKRVAPPLPQVDRDGLAPSELANDFDGLFERDATVGEIREFFRQSLTKDHDIVRLGGCTVIGLPLTWDTDLLGFECYRILSVSGGDSVHDVDAAVSAVFRQRRVDLACCRTVSGGRLDHELSSLPAWVPVSRKILFRKPLEKQSRNNHLEGWLSLERVDGQERERLLPEMWEMWRANMPESRFTSDDRLGVETARRIYREWIMNSVSKSETRIWLVKQPSGPLGGFVIARHLETPAGVRAASIDLIAARSGSRLGDPILSMAERALESESVEVLYAATEERNEHGRELFARAGFDEFNSCREFHCWFLS
jgi:hypothetical protein